MKINAISNNTYNNPIVNKKNQPSFKRIIFGETFDARFITGNRMHPKYFKERLEYLEKKLADTKHYNLYFDVLFTPHVHIESSRDVVKHISMLDLFECKVPTTRVCLNNSDEVFVEHETREEQKKFIKDFEKFHTFEHGLMAVNDTYCLGGIETIPYYADLVKKLDNARQKTISDNIINREWKDMPDSTRQVFSKYISY